MDYFCPLKFLKFYFVLFFVFIMWRGGPCQIKIDSMKPKVPGELRFNSRYTLQEREILSSERYIGIAFLYQIEHIP